MRLAQLVAGSVLAVAVAVSGCSSADPADPVPSNDPSASGGTAAVPSRLPGTGSASASRTSGQQSSPTSSAATSAASSAARTVLATLSLRQRVGQLLMIDCPSTGVTDATRTAITRYDVGSVILDGTSQAGLTATADVTRTLRGLAPSRTGLFVATDQEGGLVQRLQGPGFDRIPSGTEQGRIAPATLQADARTWGRQLRAAGVNVNLAPVLDTVPAGGGPNPPIGDLSRQYGSSPQTVTSHGLAYARGMSAAGVDPVVKHFPGLGRVTGNTDTTAGVTDSVTTADDPYLAPFRAAVQAGVPFVMMSTAIYRRLDPGVPAAFSSRIVTDLLRHDLGFGGVVVSDDIGAARQVDDVSPGERAVRFVRAGGDLVLTVVADQAQSMTAALVARAQSDPSFRAQVDAAALRVLSAKQAGGLL